MQFFLGRQGMKIFYGDNRVIPGNDDRRGHGQTDKRGAVEGVLTEIVKIISVLPVVNHDRLRQFHTGSSLHHGAEIIEMGEQGLLFVE